MSPSFKIYARCIYFLKASVLCFGWVHLSILLHTSTTIKWDQVCLQDLASVSPCSIVRVTSFNCGIKKNEHDLVILCQSYTGFVRILLECQFGKGKNDQVGWVDYVRQSPVKWGWTTITCHHTAANFFSCSLRGVFVGYRVMTAPIYCIGEHISLFLFLQLSHVLLVAS